MAKKTSKKVIRRGRVEGVEVPEHLKRDEDPDEDLETVEDEDLDSDGEDNDNDSSEDGDAGQEAEDTDGTNTTSEVPPSTATEGFEQEHFNGMPRDGIVLGPGKPVHVKGVRIGDELHLTVPTYRAVMPPHSFRYTFTIVYDRGSTVHVKDVQSFEEVAG